MATLPNRSNELNSSLTYRDHRNATDGSLSLPYSVHRGRKTCTNNGSNKNSPLITTHSDSPPPTHDTNDNDEAHSVAFSYTSTIYKSRVKFCGLSQYAIAWICFFILGTFNNFMGVVIISSAKNLVDAFNAANLIGLISWSLTSISFFTKLLNTLYLQHLSHRVRTIFTVTFNLLSICGLSAALYSPPHTLFHNFIIVLICIIVLGGTGSFSENVIVGFLKLFPPKLAGAWSSGTGFAGLFGSFFYLFCVSVLQMQCKEIYLCIVPSMLFYLIAFLAMDTSNIKKRAIGDDLRSTPQLQQQQHGGVIQVMDEEEYDDDGADTLISYQVDKEERLCCKLRRCYKLCMYRAWMLGFVYFFEYTVFVGLAAISNTNLSAKQQSNVYIYLNVSYQTGVFVSRSTVGLFSTNRFGLLTLLQFVNVVLWHCQCYSLALSRFGSAGLWIQYALMFEVGLLGGLMYVNVIHDLLCDRARIPNKNDRELCLNIVLIHIVFGMLASSIYTLVMDNTFFRYLVTRSN